MSGMTNITWSTIKFPREFVAETASYSKEKNWRSSSEFIVAAVRYIQKYNIDLHGEELFFNQTVATKLLASLEKTNNALNDFPAKIELVQRVNELKQDLSATQNNLEQCNTSSAAWKKAALSYKEEKNTALSKIEKMKGDASALEEQVKKLDMKLQAITQKVNQSLSEIEEENPMFGKEKKKLEIALATLKWILTEHEKPP